MTLVCAFNFFSCSCLAAEIVLSAALPDPRRPTRGANTPPLLCTQVVRSLIINLKLLIRLGKNEEEANFLYQSLFNQQRTKTMDEICSL